MEKGGNELFICEIYEGKEEEVKDEDVIHKLALCMGRYMTRNLVAKSVSYSNRRQKLTRLIDNW